MRNKYSGPCEELGCNEVVKIGEGFFTQSRLPSGRRYWKLKHAEHSVGYKAIGATKKVRDVKHYKKIQKQEESDA